MIKNYKQYIKEHLDVDPFGEENWNEMVIDTGYQEIEIVRDHEQILYDQRLDLVGCVEEVVDLSGDFYNNYIRRKIKLDVGDVFWINVVEVLHSKEVIIFELHFPGENYPFQGILPMGVFILKNN